MSDVWEELLLAGYNNTEQYEIRRLMAGWGNGSLNTPAHCIVYHANRHGFLNKYLLYLRVANNFNKKGAREKPLENALRWERPNGEFLIERDGLVIVYGRNSSRR